MSDEFIKVEKIRFAVGIIGEGFSSPVEVDPLYGRITVDGRFSSVFEMDNGTVVWLSLHIKE